MHKTAAVVLTVFVILMLSGLGCSDGQREVSVDNVSSGNQRSPAMQIGNSVGDAAPDFDIRLTNGETISYATLRDDRMPVFLFFYSPY